MVEDGKYTADLNGNAPHGHTIKRTHLEAGHKAQLESSEEPQTKETPDHNNLFRLLANCCRSF